MLIVLLEVVLVTYRSTVKVYDESFAQLILGFVRFRIPNSPYRGWTNFRITCNTPIELGFCWMYNNKPIFLGFRLQRLNSFYPDRRCKMDCYPY